MLTFLLVRAYISELTIMSPTSGTDFAACLKALANTAVDVWNFGTSPFGLVILLVSFFILFDAFKLWRRKPPRHG